MSGAFRLAAGGRLDRGRPLRFSFDGTGFQGLAGDTLASALLANGIHLVGRSFKYHRPRGFVAAGAEEPNALVGIGRGTARWTPNLRATQLELYDGMTAESENRWPSLAFDVGAATRALSPLLVAGFYYKTFMWPPAAWKKLYEPAIRAMAGLGRAPPMADADRYAHRYAHCDVLVVGAGPAGLAAALAASSTGARVILADEQAELGGTLLSEGDAEIDGQTAWQWLAATVAALATSANVTLLPRTTAFGYYPHNLLGLAERVTDHLAQPDPNLPRERLWLVRAKEVVLATGAIERPLVFPDNDRPGIMLADAARTYVTRYGVKPGRRAMVCTATDWAYRAALDLAEAGVDIELIADLRGQVDGALPAAARAAGLEVRAGAVVGTRGRLRVAGAQVAGVAADGSTGPARPRACDLLLMSGGFTPSVHLFSQSGGKVRFDPALQTYVPGKSVQRERSAGSCRGVFALAEVLADGYAQGEGAAKAAGRGSCAARGFVVKTFDAGSDAFSAARQPPSPSGNAFVDLQNDVTAKDIGLAVREGFHSIEHVKRYTTTGMATDQGKTSNVNALAIVSAGLGVPMADVGLTTFRPPYTPVTFGAFAGPARGALFEPVRTTPIDAWAAARGAVFENVGQWRRARYFPLAGEDMHAAVARECRAVRSSVGVFDASTLGKIEVVGRHAAEFMNRMYVNDWSRLEPGRLRYGVLLREDGFVMDDGVVGRLAMDRFHVTTTSGGAARVLLMMEDYLQTEWPQLDVWLISTTEQWAVIAVQGPRARDVIAPLVAGVDLSRMPHMSVREGRICGVPMRLFRVSFTGELGFEINVPSDYGQAVWTAVIEAGASNAITPYGTEATHVLRAEKGYVIVGQETDGTRTPDDVGLGWTIGRTKKDFVGKRALARPEMTRSDRKQLVGLFTHEPGLVLEEGAQIVAAPGQRIPMKLLGHVTSSYFSPTLGRSIALAMLAGGRQRLGATLYVPMPGRNITVQVVEPVFYDPKGERLHA